MEFPDGIRRVKVGQPMGGGGEVYYINIGGYFEGQIIKCQNGSWTVAMNAKTILVGDDICALIETIEKRDIQ